MKAGPSFFKVYKYKCLFNIIIKKARCANFFSLVLASWDAKKKALNEKIADCTAAKVVSRKLLPIKERRKINSG